MMENNQELQAMITHFEQRLTKEEQANQLYETFLSACGLATMVDEPFEFEGVSYTACKLGEGKVELKASDYPDYYGGAYIDDEGDLVIHVVGELKTCQAEIEKVLKQKEGYYVRQARYTYQALLGLKEQLDELAMNEKQAEVFANVTGYGPDDRHNLFLVEMNVVDEEQIAAFKSSISDSDMIMFKQGGNTVEEKITTIKPGRRIVSMHSSGRRESSTLTIRAFRSTSPANQGFIMSGHATEATGQEIRRASETHIGTVRDRQVGGRVDAAYAQRAHEEIILSNFLAQNNHVLSGTQSTAAVGTTVYMAGQASGIRRGRVTHVAYRDSMITGSKASYFSKAGDSGGPIYRLVSNQRRIVGVHRGSLYNSSRQRTGAIFSLIANVISEFGLWLF